MPSLACMEKNNHKLRIIFNDYHSPLISHTYITILFVNGELVHISHWQTQACYACLQVIALHK